MQERQLISEICHLFFFYQWTKLSVFSRDPKQLLVENTDVKRSLQILAVKTCEIFIQLELTIFNFFNFFYKQWQNANRMVKNKVYATIKELAEGHLAPTGFGNYFLTDIII